jgi:Ribbon-helix-helix protein, copG family
MTRSSVRPLGKHLTVAIDTHLERGLDRLAARTGRSRDALIAEALAQFVDGRGPSDVPSWVGAARRQDAPACRQPRSR